MVTSVMLRQLLRHLAPKHTSSLLFLWVHIQCAEGGGGGISCIGNCTSSITICPGWRPGEVTPASPHSVEPIREAAVWKPWLSTQRTGTRWQLTTANGAMFFTSSWSLERKKCIQQPVKREPNRRHAPQQTLQCATPAPNVAETPVSSATAVIVASKMTTRCNIHSHHRLTEAQY